MKFEIDKYKNTAVIKEDDSNDDKYTLFINDIKFKDLYFSKSIHIIYIQTKTDQNIFESCAKRESRRRKLKEVRETISRV